MSNFIEGFFTGASVMPIIMFCFVILMLTMSEPDPEEDNQ